jgi:sialic acid synthase SpsE
MPTGIYEKRRMRMKERSEHYLLSMTSCGLSLFKSIKTPTLGSSTPTFRFEWGVSDHVIDTCVTFGLLVAGATFVEITARVLSKNIETLIHQSNSSARRDSSGISMSLAN